MSVFNWGLLDRSVQNDSIGLKSRVGKDIGTLDEAESLIEGGGSVEVGSVGFRELPSFAFSFDNIDDVVNHSLFVTGFESGQVMAIRILGGNRVVSPEIFVDPDFGVSVMIEADHLISDVNGSEFVV